MENTLKNTINEPPGNSQSKRSVVAELEAKMDGHGGSPKSVIVTGSRDEMLRDCIDFGLNLTQIRDFSQSWPQPFNHVSQVSTRVEDLGLRPLAKRKKRKQVGPHNDYINRAFMRLAGQIMDRGWSVERFSRETKVLEESPVRPDFYFEAVKGDRREYLPCEIQASKTTYTLWNKKLRQ